MIGFIIYIYFIAYIAFVQDLKTTSIKLHDNLSSTQRMSLHDLKSDNNIVIKPADKGGNIVIMDKDNYMK